MYFRTNVLLFNGLLWENHHRCDPGDSGVPLSKSQIDKFWQFIASFPAVTFPT